MNLRARRGEQGFALLMVLMLMTFLGAMLAVMAQRGFEQREHARAWRDKTQAFFAAESGLQAGLRALAGGGRGEIKGEMPGGAYRVEIKAGPGGAAQVTSWGEARRGEDSVARRAVGCEATAAGGRVTCRAWERR